MHVMGNGSNCLFFLITIVILILLGVNHDPIYLGLRIIYCLDSTQQQSTTLLQADKKTETMTIQEDVSIPLLLEQKNSTDETSCKANLWMVYLSTIVSVCGSFEFGSWAGFSSPTQAEIMKDLSVTIEEYSVFGSLLTFGAMIGAITSGPMADSIGRKGAMRTATGFSVAGWLAIYFAKGALSLDIGRLATGYGMGIFSYVVIHDHDAFLDKVPVFIAEIAPKNLRGALTAVNQLLICTGLSVSFIIGTVITWRTLALTGFVPSAILLVGLFFIPESPRWLAKIGHEKEFEAALQNLRGKDSDILMEAAEIWVLKTLERLPKTKMLDLFQGRHLRSVIIGVGLMFFQHFGGISGICFYFSNIFESAGVSSSTRTIVYAILQLPITAHCTTMIDKAGRKPQILLSSTGLVLSCILSWIAFYLKDHNLAPSSVPILSVAGILIFPISIKGVPGSLATLVNWFCGWAVTYSFNSLTGWSSSGTFMLYAAICALGILFVVAMVPENKGKGLKQIQAEINA
ncbi:Sugar transporter ERD6-like 16 [Hibiscus syriacus]|uniref:Sugar transporter ERD6-like 16 n=1 Tax=Hibiscus syriacus TaxID=106335 RepID=A0A6A2ZCG6_HIBSY|nr:Sugar transporter ERD6-like 16 [Hibiscus syriacus]